MQSKPNEDSSLLSKDESNAVKGVLILLVVLAHNSILMKFTGLFSYIYSFHVYCFFILPFLYGDGFHGERASFRERIKKLIPRWKHFSVAYFTLCILCLVISLLTHKVAFNLRGVIWSIITGSQHIQSEYLGFSMIWFLPAICSVLFWHAFYFSLSSKKRMLFVFFLVILWGLAGCGVTNYHELGRFIPFALMPGLYHSLTGIGGRKVCSLPLKGWCKYLAGIAAFLFIPLWVYYRNQFPLNCYYLTWLICPVSAIFGFYQFRDLLSRIPFLQEIGKYSYFIYLTHIFIYNILFRFMGKMTFFIGLLLFFATVIINVLLIFLFEQIKHKRV